MIDAASLSTETLEAFDDMMVETVLKVEIFAPLASSIWAEVLRELDVRKRVKLMSGSYDDIGNSLIRRLR